MNRICLKTILILICALTLLATAAIGAMPVTPNASPGTRALLNFVYAMYGKGGGERFVRLWRTMFDYFTKERKLNNLIWVLCHTGDPKAAWNPGKAYYDLSGPDTYAKGIQACMFNEVQAIHGNTIPIPYHECGTIPDPNECFEKGITWSWWMLCIPTT